MSKSGNFHRPNYAVSVEIPCPRPGCPYMASRLKHLRQHLNCKGFTACATYYEKTFKTKVADMAVDEIQSQKSSLTAKTTMYVQQVMVATAVKK